MSKRSHKEMTVKPETEVALAEQTLVLEQGHIYVHCYYKNGEGDNLIRIWKSTVLIDKVSGVRAPLIHVENITYAPTWTRVPNNSTYRFLLIFESLPSTCVAFDLLEDIPEPGGFFVEGILRNQTDVYHVQL